MLNYAGSRASGARRALRSRPRPSPVCGLSDGGALHRRHKLMATRLLGTSESLRPQSGRLRRMRDVNQLDKYLSISELTTLRMNATAKGTPTVPKPRLIHNAWLYVNDWSSAAPWMFIPTVRFRPGLQPAGEPHQWVTPTTEIVIEGYPRSANTFALVAFQLAQSRELEIAHHLHAAAQIKRAVALGVPAIVLVREPSEAVLSLMVRDPSASMRWAIRSYVRFYSNVVPSLDKVVVAPFAKITSDFGSIIRKVNIQYGTAFKEFESTPDFLKSVHQTVEWMGKRDSMRTGQDYSRGLALPSEARRHAKDARRSEYLDERNKSLRAKAEALYERVMESVRK